MTDTLDQTWDDSDLVMISALEHYSYCPRQCALIHVEQSFDENVHTLWGHTMHTPDLRTLFLSFDENVHTLRGHLLHERVDEPTTELQADVRIERALPLWSKRLGLVGKADAIEFHNGDPYPIEYKVGPRRKWGHDDLQLCAQALCLEEMTGHEVPRGAIYYHGSRRRKEVVCDAALRQRVAETIVAVRQMLATGILPPAVNDARCQHCSLKESCLPGVVGEAWRLQSLQTTLFRVAPGL